MRNQFLPTATGIAAILFGLAMHGLSIADDPVANHHHHVAKGPVPTAFVASRDKAYGVLVDEAMAVMSDGMAKAPMNGNADHDFASMMVPHHQGAVDMAKAELLYGTNPVLRRLAQEIIVTQGQEIEVMQMELKKSPKTATAKP